MKNLTLENIARVCEGTYHGPEEKKQKEAAAIVTDSRKIQEGAVFIPIVGERVDAHRFIPDVMKKGALCTLSEVDLGEQGFPWILVESSLAAIKEIAEFYLEQLEIPVVGITGSVGKTSTKEVVASVLEQKYNTLKTQGNFNNELGLPLTVFRLRDEHEMAVLEMGISQFQEMSRLAKIAKPDTCLITNIGQCHLENLGDRDGVLKAKTEAFAFLTQNGHIILNGDDDKLVSVKAYKGIRPVFFGLNDQFPVYATDIHSGGLKGMSCRIHIKEDSFEVWIPMPGKHMVYNALAAAAVGMVYGLTPAQIKAGIESLKPVSGRFHMIETENFFIVDDCYNANPMSMKASVQVLQDGLARRVAILGDMGELGEKQQELHKEVGRFAAQQDIELLICVGKLCKGMAAAAREQNTKVQVLYIQDLETLLQKLPTLVKKGDTILVKASHFMQFETVVEKLKNLK